MVRDLLLARLHALADYDTNGLTEDKVNTTLAWFVNQVQGLAEYPRLMNAALYQQDDSLRVLNPARFNAEHLLATSPDAFADVATVAVAELFRSAQIGEDQLGVLNKWLREAYAVETRQALPLVKGLDY